METGFEMTVETSNDAFEEDYTGETVRILKDVASKIERGSHSGPVVDVNGNTIGNYYLSREGE